MKKGVYKKLPAKKPADKKPAAKKVIGIDFGTTKTMVAWVNPKTGQHELIRLGEGRDYIPTTVFVESGGGMLFGEDADNEAVMAPQQYCRCFKMKMGSSSPALMFFEENTPRSYSARQLAAAFLRHVKTLCEEKAVYDKVDAAVITRPVNFTPAQEEDLRLAAEEAGFKEITFITEPEAAGYAFCRLCPDEAFAHKALVVDWGGGTLDMAVVERQGEKVKTNRKYTSGDNTMGGEMFDADLWHFVRTSVPELNVDTLAVQHNAHVQVRKAKEALSKRDEKSLSISTSAGPVSISVKRADFEALIGASVEKAAQQANSLVNKISKDSAAPEMLLLVGGSALIPLIQQQMESVTRLPSRKWQYTREAVAIGAALWLSSAQSEKCGKSQPKSERATGFEKQIMPGASHSKQKSASSKSANGRKPTHKRTLSSAPLVSLSSPVRPVSASAPRATVNSQPNTFVEKVLRDADEITADFSEMFRRFKRWLNG